MRYLILAAIAVAALSVSAEAHSRRPVRRGVQLGGHHGAQAIIVRDNSLFGRLTGRQQVIFVH